ncbi:MAG TPA: hypothetical protein VK843_15275 [Planctomycetota bacterium]|nr:hypothetical protein [Planctomycetota bacterium]
MLGLLERLKSAFTMLRPATLRRQLEHNALGPAFHELVRVRSEFYDQVAIGPMTPAEVDAFIAPYLVGAPADLAVELEATLDQVELDNPS